MQGRKKAQYIVNAVMCYESSMQQSGQSLSDDQSFHCRIKAIVQQLLSEEPSLKKHDTTIVKTIETEKPKRKIFQPDIQQNDINISDEDVSMINDMISELRK